MRITTIIPSREPHLTSPQGEEYVRWIYDEGRGKKWALQKGVSAARTEYVYLTDDDVEIPRASEDELLAAMGDADMMIMPLRMRTSGVECKGVGSRVLEQMLVAEYAAIQQLTLETARRGHAVMCSGANLLVRRERWLESYEDLHPEVASGDDMFLLESFKRRRLKIVAAPDGAKFDAYITAPPTLSALFRQRMRWAGKAPKYSDKDILCCGAAIVLVNMLQLVFPLLLLVKFPVEYALIRRRDTVVKWWAIVLLELVYPLYMIACVVGGLFRKKW